MKRISIVGLGYIGLPTALIAAKHNRVFGYDVDEKKIDDINNGVAPIVEPGIQELLCEALEQHQFCASTTLESADYFVIAVPTPFTATKEPDLSYVLEAGAEVAKKLMPGNTVILESTVPVGTTQKLTKLLEEHSGLQAGKDFYCAYCPERVLPGRIVAELVSNDRIIGGTCPRSAQLARNFYATFVNGALHLTTDKTAEMVKLVENSSRDVQIAFANQVAAMADAAGIDPFEVIHFANKHPRVNILRPGCGVGGHCIAVDPWFLIKGFPNATQLLAAARDVNDAKPHHVINQVTRHAEKFFTTHGRKPNIIALGLTFKPDIDDLRESPALLIAKTLNKKTTLLDLRVHDPFVSSEVIASHGLDGVADVNAALEWADITLILVPHSSFKTIDKKFLSTTIDKVPPWKVIPSSMIDPCGLNAEGAMYETTVFGERDGKNIRRSDATTES